MKKIFQNLIKYCAFLVVVLVYLSCATPAKKDSLEGSEKATSASAGDTFITGLNSEMLEDGARIHIKASSPIQYTAFKLDDPLRLVLDISDMQPKPEVQKSIQFNKGAISTISTSYFDESNITRVTINLNQNVPHDISKPDNNELEINIDLPSEIQAESGVTIPIIEQEEPYSESAESEISTGEEDTATEKKFTGKAISLDFQNADLKSILRLIAGVSGFNIITSPEVQGTLSLRLVDVPWDQALDLILKNNALGMTKEGNIIRITTSTRLAQEKAEEKAAGDIEKKVEELKSKTISISYADLAELQTTLDSIKSARGSIEIDKRTNTISITDIQSNIDRMAEKINLLDRRTKQISIEARIVEVNTSYAKQLGIQWGGAIGKNTNEDFPGTIAIGGGGTTSGSLGTQGFLVDLPAAAGSGAGGAISMALGSASGAYLLDVRLSAMESEGEGKIISSPKVTVLNHMQASISSGTTFYIETAAESGGSQTTPINADIALTVTPHANPDGFILLEILTTKNEAVLTDPSNPTVTTKTISTEVLVKNGDTTVLGGLYKTSRGDSNAGVPFLSKIPLLGWLFKHKTETTSAEELLIFITPTLVADN